jgi:hypothetical protein
MFGGGVASAVVSGVALGHGAANLIDDGFPESGAEIVLVAGLAGVNLDGHLAGEGGIQKLIELQDCFGRDVAGKVYLGFHVGPPYMYFKIRINEIYSRMLPI